MNQFRSGEKDVMVATDVASKGLDFPDIQHVINYDLPEDIENYGKCYDQPNIYRVTLLLVEVHFNTMKTTLKIHN